ncbi:Hpt domain-containing protein [Andreprevotia chitinilytica]|uniref:Hpt domain-containing protein n=1 Tax=Andreprevotia chitinilytica TaxID=396808 RepID=UPI00054E9CB8|nr:Hpt domain-containing protein [Andreprevotia chitinilytica]
MEDTVYQHELASVEATFVQLQETLGMDLRKELLDAYFATQDECLLKLDLALPDQSAQAVIEAAHKLKGAAAQLGAFAMADHCKCMEQGARSGRLDQAAEHLQPIRALASQLASDLKAPGFK